MQVSRQHIHRACDQITTIVESISSEQTVLKQQMIQLMTDLIQAKTSIDDLALRFKELSRDQSHNSKCLQSLIVKVDSHEDRIKKIEQDQEEIKNNKKSSLGYHSLDGSRQNSANNIELLEPPTDTIPTILVTEQNP